MPTPMCMCTAQERIDYFGEFGLWSDQLSSQTRCTLSFKLASLPCIHFASPLALHRPPHPPSR